MYKLFNTFLLLTSFVASTLAQSPTGGPGGPGIPNTGQPPATTSIDNSTPRGNAKITGSIIDSSSAKGVEFASVALINAATNKPIDGTVADEKGAFTLSKIADGEYRLLISFVGFADKTIPNIRIEKSQTLDVGTIRLASNVKTLNEVTVTGQKALVEEKVDRLVFNAERDLTSKGGDASDVLRRVPMLTVDLDGNVSLRGSENIRVLINNKPSTIVASSVADALKQIPADMIKTVEVITSPSAKYDAEGSGGIINIITKKNTLQGLTLNVDGGVGNRASNLGINGSYRQGKLGITLGGFGRAFYNKAISTLDQSAIQNGATQLTRQQVNAFDNGLFGQYSLGLDYDLGPNQSLTAGLRYGVRNFSRNQDLSTNLFTDNLLTGTSYRDVDSRDLSNSVDVNVDYVRTFNRGEGQPKAEWSVSTQYSRNNLTNNFYADLLDSASTVTGRQQNINGNINQEITFQTDYQTPIGKNQQLEIGAKEIVRQVNSDYQYLIGGSTGELVTDSRQPAGVLNYNQNITAGYLSYTLSTKNKYTFKLGTRYEYTTISANTGSEGSSIAIPDYSNLVPSLNISKSLKGGTTLKAAYNRRIQRPGLQQLNPNFNAANPQNITIGNPSLAPELTDNFELGLSANIGKTYLTTSLFARLTDNAINRVSQPSDTLPGAIVTTFRNIGSERAYGTNIFANVTITPKWTLSGGADLFYAQLQGQVTGVDGQSVGITNSGWVVSGRLMSQLTLGKGWGIQAFGFTRGNRVQLQGRQSGFSMYSLGVRKDFNDKRGSIGLAAENFLTKGMRIRSSLTSPTFTQVSDTQLLNQGVRLTFSYKIGKMSFDTSRRKTRSISNDDVKGDGGGDNGGSQPMQGGTGGSRPR